MPVEYTFFTDPPLTVLRYHGHILLDEIMEKLAQYAQEPDHAPGRPHLFDYTKITSYDVDHAKYFQFMAQLSDVYPEDAGEQLMVFVAKDGPAMDLAEMGRRPWTKDGKLLIRIVNTFDQAFDILGGAREDVIAHIHAV